MRGITTAEKIFIDVDDEINFVVNKLLSAEKEHIILVVPQNALVVSSKISLQILAKQILKSKKSVVMVTEDQFGSSLAAQVGLVTTTKVSNITPELWETSELRKKKQLEEVEQRKTELLTRRGIGGTATQVPVPQKEELAEVGVGDAEVALNEEEEEVKPTSEEEEAAKGLEDVEEEEIKGAIQRVRPDAKLVKIGGIEVFAGGDVAMIESQGEEVESNEMASSSEPKPRKQVLPERPRGGFTGKDWTKYTPDGSGGMSFGKLWPFKKQPKPLAPGERKPIMSDSDAAKKKKRLKIVAGVTLGILLLFLAGGYVLAFSLSSVDVEITLKTTEVPVEQQITIDVAAIAIDEETLTLPAKPVVEDELSISASDSATGKGKKGTKAAGLIEIWNKTDKAVTLLEGTKLTQITSNKVYILKEKATLPASQDDPDDPNIHNYGGVGKELRIEASDVGEEYNLTKPDENLEFKVEGYSTDSLIGKRFRNIEGGTSEEIIIVSKDDIKRVKDKLVEALEDQGKDQLAVLVPDGYRLIEGTEVFEETKFEAMPKEGEEAESFSLSIEGKISALAVKEEDLSKAIEILILRNTSSTNETGAEGEEEAEGTETLPVPEGEFEVTGLNDAVIANVKREGDKATFVITSQGSLRSKLTEEDLKANMAGKSIPDAQAYLAGIEEIEKFRLNFSPGIVPEGIRRVPTDAARINIRFK